MSKSTVILNGENTSEVRDYTTDANVNMGAAINDNSCSKHIETFNSKDNKAIVPYPCDFDHLYASNMSENENFSDKNSEFANLRELLLLHLDLIQQQSEQLFTKEKQISALKQENDTLKQRLERMDRRVTLQKHKELSEVLSSSNHASTSLPEIEIGMESCAQVAETSSSNTQQNDAVLSPITVQETNSVIRRRRRDDKMSASSSVLSASGPKRRNRSLSWTSSVTSTEVMPSAKVNGGKLVKRERQQRRERIRKKRSKKDSIDKEDDNILTTDTPYYTPVGDADNIWNVDEVPASGCVLEVPSWRVKVFTSCYTMEGTENLSDDVFERRHSRLEIDERRRKRWDVQRIREQRQLEKLRQRGKKRRDGSGGGSDTEEVESLWPSPDQAQFLQVSDSVPVAAFGCPITKFSATDSEFTLPWVNGRDFGRSRPSYVPRKKR